MLTMMTLCFYAVDHKFGNGMCKAAAGLALSYSV